MLTDGVVAADTQDFSLAIRLAITTTSLPEATADADYAAYVAAAGGELPYSWAVTSGSLPDGVAINGATGEISGVPTVAGTYDFNVEVTDNAGATDEVGFAITVHPPLSVSTTSLSQGTEGTSYAETVEGNGGTTPYAWDVFSGELPADLELGSGSGDISGTPTAAGLHPFVVEVTDAAGATASMTLSININTPPVLTTGSLPNGTTGAAYDAEAEADGGTTPYASWEVISGTLPAGLDLDESNGQISGTPETAGAEAFELQVTDAAGATASVELSITVHQAPVVITVDLPDGTVTMEYAAVVEANHGTLPKSESTDGPGWRA